MEKKGTEHIVCTECGEEAVPGTNPPMCMKHLKKDMDKKASTGEPTTLKELENREPDNGGRH